MQPLVQESIYMIYLVSCDLDLVASKTPPPPVNDNRIGVWSNKTCSSPPPAQSTCGEAPPPRRPGGFRCSNRAVFYLYFHSSGEFSLALFVAPYPDRAVFFCCFLVFFLFNLFSFKRRLLPCSLRSSISESCRRRRPRRRRRRWA